jgi:hypothetical protein
VVPIASFLLSVRGEVPTLLWGHRGSLAVTVGSTGYLCTMKFGPPRTHRVADCHSVEELGFQILDRRDMTLLQGGAV